MQVYLNTSMSEIGTIFLGFKAYKLLQIYFPFYIGLDLIL
jgi:hypothetical protein